jgi:hypothetical protein
MLIFGGALKSFKFNIISFIIGFIIGMCYIYQKQPPLIEKIIYPTPHNAGKITYKTVSGDCFQYNAETVECPEDKSLIKQHIIDSDLVTKEDGIFDKFKKIFD